MLMEINTAFMLQKKMTKVFLLVFFINAFSLNASNDYVIYSTKDTALDNFKIKFILYKNSFDKELIRIQVKITPRNDSTIKKINKNKKELMFNKLNSLLVKSFNDELIIVNDYVYEELLDNYSLIYTIINMNEKKIKNVYFIDELITNKIKITLL